MACSHIQTEEEKCWLKCWLAVFITRDGLANFVQNTISSIHTTAVNGIQTGSPCKTSAQGTAPHKKCDVLFEQIITKNHTNKHWDKLSEKEKWKNSKQSKLCTSEWEFAKCFIHAQGYKDKTNIHETDLNGVISIIKNCSEFQNYFSFQLSDKAQPLEKVW